MFDDKKLGNSNIFILVSFVCVTLATIYIYSSFYSSSFNDFSRSNAPQGQGIYIISKFLAIGVYFLMWCQIMLGIFTVLKTKHHVFLGVTILFLVISHVVLFIMATSLRQNELEISILFPDFSSGYYQLGISFGIVALLCVFIASIIGAMRHWLPNSWKLGHGLVYLTFMFATIHGLMIGSDITSPLLSYVIYSLMLSLVVAVIYKNRPSSISMRIQ